VLRVALTADGFKAFIVKIGFGLFSFLFLEVSEVATAPFAPFCAFWGRF
jgi:hypothetical protein